MSWLTKIFGSKAADVAEKVAGIADNFITTGEERQDFRLKVGEILTGQFQALETTIQAEVKAKADVMIAELQQSDNYTKRARPSVVYAGLVFAFLEAGTRIAAYFTGTEITGTIVPEWFYAGWAGVTSIYVISRSSEKRGADGNLITALIGKRKDVRNLFADE